jgi:hypothetical protein
VRELEEQKFLEPLSEAERFVQLRPGTWTAVFVKASRKVAVLNRDAEEQSGLVKDLVARGITRRSAQKLVQHHPEATIREKLRMFDAMRSGGGEGKIRNRAGWLYSAIVHDYSAPGNEKKVALVERSQPAPAKALATEASAELTAVSEEAAAFDTFWAALSLDQQETFEGEAVAAAPAFLQKQYHDGRAGQTTLWRVTRQRILADYFKTICLKSID